MLALLEALAPLSRSLPKLLRLPHKMAASQTKQPQRPGPGLVHSLLVASLQSHTLPVTPSTFSRFFPEDDSHMNGQEQELTADHTHNETLLGANEKARSWATADVAGGQKDQQGGCTQLHS